MPRYRKLHTRVLDKPWIPDGYVPRRSWFHERAGRPEPEAVYIYALVEPGTDDIRYIGKTHGDLGQRLNLHISEARRSIKTSKDAWIASLLWDGKRPELVVLGLVPYGVWPLAELAFIRWARERGTTLLNEAGAGGGP